MPERRPGLGVTGLLYPKPNLVGTRMASVHRRTFDPDDWRPVPDYNEGAPPE